MNVLGAERGWGRYTRANFDAARSFDGALYVGSPETVAQKNHSPAQAGRRHPLPDACSAGYDAS